MRSAKPNLSDSVPSSALRRATVPPSIPGYDLVRSIGSGSYGEVWMARNALGAFRAIKIVYREAFESSRPFERELAGLRKFEPISRSHEGLIQVLHLDLAADGAYFFYVMELGDDAEGGQQIDPLTYRVRTLRALQKEQGRLAPADCIALGVRLGHALEQIHRHGLVHRDIKPSNIIFVNGVPKLADVGLVSSVNEARSFVGTDGYIPPEGPGTFAADVFSLGKVLYELCTGRDRNDFPALPTDLPEGTAAAELVELNEVVLKACHQEPAQRYRQVGELISDLHLLQAGRSVKRLKLLEERLSTLKRVLLLALPAAAVVLALLFQQQRVHYREALLRERQVGTLVANGQGRIEEGDYLGALRYFADALGIDRDNEERLATHLLRFGSVLEQCPKLAQLWSREPMVRDARFGADGKSLLISEWLGKAVVLSAEGFEVVPPFGPSSLRSAAFHPDGQHVVAASMGNHATVWLAAEGKETLKLEHPSYVYSAVFDRTGNRIATACGDKMARIWDYPSGTLLFVLEGHRDEVLSADFNESGTLLLTTSKDGTARAWHAGTGLPTGAVFPHQSWVHYAAFSPEGDKVVTASFDRTARLWEVESGRPVGSPMRHSDAVHMANFSPDGRSVVTASWDSTVRIWDALTGMRTPLNNLFTHSSRVMSARFAPDGRRIVCACADGTIWLWDLGGEAALVREVSQPNAEATPTAEVKRLFTGDRRLIQTVATRQGTRLEFVDLHRGEIEVSLLLTNVFAPRALAWAGPAGVIVDSKYLHRVSLRDRVEARLAMPPSASNAWIHFDRSGGLAALLKNQEVFIWDSRRGQMVTGPLQHESNVGFAAFSPDNQVLVTCCRDDQLAACAAHLWDVRSGMRLGEPLQHRDGVLEAAFSSDGRRVVTASEDFSAVVWETASGHRVSAPMRHQNQVLSAAFSGNGEWVITASKDQTARLWDASTGEAISPPIRHGAPVVQASFACGDTRVVTVDSRGAVTIWLLKPELHETASLLELAHLVSPSWGQVDGTVAGKEALLSGWARLHAEHSGWFKVGAAEAAAWHRQQLRPDSTVLVRQLHGKNAGVEGF